MSHLLWPLVLAHHPAYLLPMVQGLAIGWTWLNPPVTERVA